MQQNYFLNLSKQSNEPSLQVIERILAFSKSYNSNKVIEIGCYSNS
jgi:hypothetical protein